MDKNCNNNSIIEDRKAFEIDLKKIAPNHTHEATATAYRGIILYLVSLYRRLQNAAVVNKLITSCINRNITVITQHVTTAATEIYHKSALQWSAAITMKLPVGDEAERLIDIPMKPTQFCEDLCE
ncbi:uncharacterized protein LOC113552549 [Rhopalosiphum maidis]|uniref:uncharacterized protein LOC113552549 n=1 Tax=Rhopalosiphum maidis TaxID=43146 RepID=UPI000EFE6744|nr:uncharacterized protein LOC113552549 [Rhopalosiphum maidis]